MHLDRQHIVHYLIILGILFLGFSLFAFFGSNKTSQLIVGILIAFLYLCYGVIHHFLEHDLTIKIVVEYVLVALLVAVLFIFIRGGQ